MKIMILAFSVISIVSFTISACPTCVGRITPDSPPFFSAEFYKTNQTMQRETKEQFGHRNLKQLIESKKGKK